MDSKQYWKQIYSKNEQVHSLMSTYWEHFSNVATLQFWGVLFIFLFPLVLLYFFVDRKRIFELFFFGYTVHMLWTYVIIAFSRNNLFFYKYFLTPDLPYALNVTASVLPVGFLLLYQYCTNRRKSFLLYTLMLSAIFAFGLATIEIKTGFIELKKGLNQIHLFIIDLIIVLISYWSTKLLLKIKT